ncbi:MAG: glutamate racemase [Bdellovibrionales bacterium RIFCSPHIGHO2_01_FULL_40_29]|nr:MAG: glutamate racemase [Bdellovibrionales bacterium RIFCSPHIGHO2_01_FULL_40_29]
MNHELTECIINRAIGVFDSGIGGITVLKELIRKFPFENFIYLGDTARLPYGSKSPDTVRQYSLQNMDFLISRNVKAIVVACNTASTQIFETDYKNTPIYNVIDPGAKKAALATENKKIAVLATRATVAAGSYTLKIKLHLPDAEVFSQACPLFVPLAEEGWHDDPITNLIAFRYLQNLKSLDIDTAVLGCTHYPLLKSAIAKVFGNHVALIDSGEALAEELAIDFERSRMPQKTLFEHGSLTLCLTDAGQQFENLSLNLLSEVISIQPQFETVSVI